MGRPARHAAPEVSPANGYPEVSMRRPLPRLVAGRSSLVLASAAFLASLALSDAARSQCPPLPPSETRCSTPAYLTSQWWTVFPDEGTVFHVAEGTCVTSGLTLADD